MGLQSLVNSGLLLSQEKCHHRFWIHTTWVHIRALALINWVTTGKLHILVLQFSYLYNGIIVEVTDRVVGEID